MDTLKDHKHTGTDSHKLYAGESLENAPQEAVTAVSGTADLTYSSNERDMINNSATAINDLITKLQAIGILK